MKLKKTTWLAMDILALTAVMFTLLSFGSATFGPEVNTGEATPEQSAITVVGLVAISLIDTIVLTVLVLRSRLPDPHLTGVAALVYYGTKTLIPTIETWYLTDNVTPDTIWGLFLMTLPVTLLFPPVAVLLLARAKKYDRPEKGANARLVMPAGQLAWKVGLLGVGIYPALRIAFGGEPVTYLSQVFLGLLWVGLAVPVIRTAKGRAWEAGLVVAMLFSFVACNVHLIPNMLMPAEIHAGRGIETAATNFIWGWVCVWLLHRRHGSLRDLFSLHPEAGSATSTS